MHADSGFISRGLATSVFFYGDNWFSLLGGAITTAAAMVLIGFWVVRALGHGGSSSPYLGIIFDLLLPGSVVIGRVLHRTGERAGITGH